MNISASVRQFAKDGLVGVLVVLVVFAMLLGLGLWFGIEGADLDDLREVLGDLFFSSYYNAPMPLVIAIVFLSVGLCGKRLEQNGARTTWIPVSFLVVFYSWIVGIIIYLLFQMPGIIRIGIFDIFDSLEIPILLSGIGALIGFILGALAGCIFNPYRRLFRIVIGAISSTFVGYGVGASIMLVGGF